MTLEVESLAWRAAAGAPRAYAGLVRALADGDADLRRLDPLTRGVALAAMVQHAEPEVIGLLPRLVEQLKEVALESSGMARAVTLSLLSETGIDPPVDLIPGALELLDHADSDARLRAAWFLHKFPKLDPVVIERIGALAGRDPHPDIREALGELVQKLRPAVVM